MRAARASSKLHACSSRRPSLADGEQRIPRAFFSVSCEMASAQLRSTRVTCRAAVDGPHGTTIGQDAVPLTYRSGRDALLQEVCDHV